MSTLLSYGLWRGIPIMTSDILCQYVRNNLDSAHQIKLRRHQYLYSEGDSANEIYFVEEGLVMVTKLLAEGREVGIMLLSENNMLGHCEVLSGIDREYQATALTNCSIWAVKSKNFLNEMKNSIEFSMAIAQLQNENIRQSGRHISTISHCDVTSRLINTLNDIVKVWAGEKTVTLLFAPAQRTKTWLS